MNHIRRTVAVLAGLVAGVIAAIASASAAFAARLSTGDSGPSPVAPIVVHHGSGSWQPALFALAAAVIATLAIAAVRSHRRSARPCAAAG
jgi:hypothetical protein